ncbi:MAG: AsmA family protein [Acidiferrobacterales bacterium]|nr:AsmA family protein [Acidiferrobacterales bacterium]
MFSFIKWLFLSLILLLAVAIAVPVAATFLVEQETVKHQIESWFLKNTGRALNIAGEVGFEPGLEIRLFVEDVKLQNPKWAGRPLALSARRAELTIALLPLFERQIEVKSLMLQGADLWVEHHELEGSNLKLLRTMNQDKEVPRPVPSWFAIKRVDILDSQIVVPSRSEKRNTIIRLKDASLVSDSLDSPVDVRGAGSINGLNVDLEGTANNLGSVLSRSSTKMDLLLTTPGGDKVTALGDVDDVLTWQKIDAQIEFDLPSVPNLSPLFVSRPMDIRSLSGTARFRQPGTVSTMALDEIAGDFSYLDISFVLAGDIKKLSRLEGLNLKIAADENIDLTKLMLLQGKEPLDKLDSALSISLTLTGAARKSRVDLNQFDFSTGDVELSASGGFDVEKGNWDAPLQLRMTIPNLKTAGKRFGKTLPDVGELNIDGLLSRSDQQFRMSEIKVSNSSTLISIDAKGALQNLGRETEGQIQFTGDAISPFFRQSFFQLPLFPDSGEIEGNVEVSSGQPKVNIGRTKLQLPGTELRGKGSIEGLKTGEPIRLLLESEIENWRTLADAVQQPLPDIGRAVFTAELLGKVGEPLSLKSIFGKLDHSENQATLEGYLENLGESMEGELYFTAFLPQQLVAEAIEPLEFTESHLSESVPVQLSGNLMRSSQEGWSLEDLLVDTQISGAAINVSGEFSQFAPAKGRMMVSAKGEIEPDSLPSQLSLPPLENVDLTFEVPIGEGGSRIEQLRGVFDGDAGEIRFNADRVKFSDGLQGLFDIQINTSDLLTATNNQFGFRNEVPLTADIELELRSDRWLASAAMVSGQNDFEGTIAFNRSTDRPRLEIEGNSKQLDVDSLLIRPPKEERFFSERPLLPEWMSRFDGSINLMAERFSNHALDLDTLDASIRYDNQQVAVRVSADRGEGTLLANFDFPVDRDSRLQVISSGLPVTAFRSLMRRGIFQGGVVDMHVNLAGPGRTLSGILSDGQGVVGLDINDSSIKGSALDSVGGDIFSNLLRIFNPFIKKDKLVNVDCGAIRFDVLNGKATTRNGLAMKTDRVTLLGAGELTLKNEGLKLEIAPKPRKGFGISASSFAKMIRLGGTLSNPDVEASATGFFKSGAAIGAAIFSGGLSLIGQGLLDRLTANDNVCALARGEIDKLPDTFDDVQNR